MDQPIERKVNFLLFLAILFLPMVFAWYLLNKGFSRNARILAFGWMALISYQMINAPPAPEAIKPTETATLTSTTALTAAPTPAKIETPKAPDPAIIRGLLASEYLAFISSNNRRFNFIESKLVKGKKGYTLWATHEYFNQYSLSIGHNGKEIQEWINDNGDRIHAAKIVKIGLKNSDSGSSAWFDIK